MVTNKYRSKAEPEHLLSTILKPDLNQLVLLTTLINFITYGEVCISNELGYTMQNTCCLLHESPISWYGLIC